VGHCLLDSDPVLGPAFRNRNRIFA